MSKRYKLNDTIDKCDRIVALINKCDEIKKGLFEELSNSCGHDKGGYPWDCDIRVCPLLRRKECDSTESDLCKFATVDDALAIHCEILDEFAYHLDRSVDKDKPKGCPLKDRAHCDQTVLHGLN